MIHNLMLQLQGGDAVMQENGDTNERTSNKVFDEQPCKEVLRQCVPHLCTSVQQDIEPTVNPVIPFGIDYREISLKDYVNQLSSSILSMIIEESVDIEDEDVPDNNSQEILTSFERADLQSSLGRPYDETDNPHRPWSLRGSVRERGTLVLGQRIPNVPYDRRLEGLTHEEEGKAIYLPVDNGGLNGNETREVDRLSEDTVTENSEESDKESDSETDARTNRYADTQLVKYPSSLLSKNDSQLQLSADDSCSSTDVEEGEPRFVSPPDSVKVICGQSLKVDCRVQGSRPIDVFWYRDSTTLVQLDGDKYLITRRGHVYSLEFTDPALHDSGLYLCIAVNEHGHCQHRFVVTVADRYDSNTQLNGHQGDLTSVNDGSILYDESKQVKSSDASNKIKSPELKRGDESSEREALENDTSENKVSTVATETNNETVNGSSPSINGVSATILSAEIVSPMKNSGRDDSSSDTSTYLAAAQNDISSFGAVQAAGGGKTVNDESIIDKSDRASSLRLERDRSPNLVLQDLKNSDQKISKEMVEEAEMVSTSFLNSGPVTHAEYGKGNERKDNIKNSNNGNNNSNDGKVAGTLIMIGQEVNDVKVKGPTTSSLSTDRRSDVENSSCDEFEKLYESEIRRSFRKSQHPSDDKMKVDQYLKNLNQTSQYQVDKENSSTSGHVDDQSKSEPNLVPLLLDFSIADTRSQHKSDSSRTMNSPWSRDKTQLTKDSGISMPDSPRSSWSGSDTPNSGMASPPEYRHLHKRASDLERSASKVSSQLSWSAESESSSVRGGRVTRRGEQQLQNKDSIEKGVLYREASGRFAIPQYPSASASYHPHGADDLPLDKEFDFIEARDRFTGSGQRSRRLSNTSSCSSSTYDLDSELEGAPLPSVKDLKKVFDKNREETGVRRVYSLTTRIPPPSLRGPQKTGAPQGPYNTRIPVGPSNAGSPAGPHSAVTRPVSADPTKQRSLLSQNYSTTRSSIPQGSHSGGSSQGHQNISMRPASTDPIRQRVPSSQDYTTTRSSIPQQQRAPGTSPTSHQQVKRGHSWSSTNKDANPSRLPQLKSPGSPPQQTMEATYVPLSPKPVHDHVRRESSSSNTARF